MSKRVIAALIALLLAGGPCGSPALAEGGPELPEERSCRTIEELAELLARGEGGTVTVLEDLVLAERHTVRIEVEDPVTVDLGEHGIRLSPGASLALFGPILVTGTGAPRPLVTVEGGVPYRGLYLGQGAELAAAGDNAAAVELAGGVLGASGAAIRAEGREACAVRLVGEPSEEYEYGGRYEFHIMEATLLAKGEGAVCVQSPIPVRLTMCRAESAEALVDAPALTLDATQASPVPEDARVVSRVAVPHTDLPNSGVWIARGAPREELDLLLERYFSEGSEEYGLTDPEGVEETWNHIVGMTWTGGAVDLDTPGVTWFTGTPGQEEIAGVPLPELRVPVVVADPARPGLMAAYPYEGGVRIALFRPICGEEDVKLWFSVDGGASWQDAGALPGAELGEEALYLPQLPERNRDYLFRMEVVGGTVAGRSNTLRCPYYDNGWGWGGGGDWDGGDWGDQGALPDDDPAPPPDREPDSGPSPEVDDAPPEPEREDFGDAGEPERPGRSEPNAVPMPVPGPLDAGESFMEAVPAPAPVDLAEREEPVLPERAALPAPEAVPAPPPAPTPPAPPEDAAPALPEGATVSLTGRDLEAQKIANPSGVALTGDGLKLVLPYALTDALELGPEGVLAVRLALLEGGRFEVRYWADGEEVPDFGGGAFTVSVPVEDAQGASYFCAAPDGTEIAASASANDQVGFELTAAGVYTLTVAAEEPALSAAPGPAGPVEPVIPADPSVSAEPVPQFAPLLPLFLGAFILAALGAVLLLRRKRGRR